MGIVIITENKQRFHNSYVTRKSIWLATRNARTSTLDKRNRWIWANWDTLPPRLLAGHNGPTAGTFRRTMKTKHWLQRLLFFESEAQTVLENWIRKYCPQSTTRISRLMNCLFQICHVPVSLSNLAAKIGRALAAASSSLIMPLI
jgi:hypothetical protein